MSKKIIRTSLALAVSVMLVGCHYTSMAGVSVNNGNESDATVKKEIRIGNFNEVSVSQGIKVVFEQGDNTGIAYVATTPSAEKYLSVTVKDNVLEAHYNNSGKMGNQKIKGPSIIRVACPSLKEIDLSSGAMFEINGTYNSDGKLEIDLSSGSSFSGGNISCTKLTVDVSSGASAHISNFTGNLNAEASSGSNADIDKVSGDLLSLEASSGAAIDVNGIDTEEVYAEASSGGSVSLSGKTIKLKKDTSSGGSVRTGGLTIGK